MRRFVFPLVVVTALCLGALVLLGAAPAQRERPPQPFFPDFISGSVTLQGQPAPAGTVLVACIDDCDSVYQSEPKTIGANGRYELLVLAPEDEVTIGRDVYFYLVNEHGRIQAVETHQFVGVRDIYTVDLTFTGPLPTAPVPTPTPTPVPTPTPTPVPTQRNAHAHADRDAHPDADAHADRDAHAAPAADPDGDTAPGRRHHGVGPAPPGPDHRRRRRSRRHPPATGRPLRSVQRLTAEGNPNPNTPPPAPRPTPPSCRRTPETTPPPPTTPRALGVRWFPSPSEGGGSGWGSLLLRPTPFTTVRTPPS